MTRQKPPPKPQPGKPSMVPAGAPSWITGELIQQTLRVWQPYYATPLTLDDALAMLLNVGRLCGELSKGS